MYRIDFNNRLVKPSKLDKNEPPLMNIDNAYAAKSRSDFYRALDSYSAKDADLTTKGKATLKVKMCLTEAKRSLEDKTAWIPGLLACISFAFSDLDPSRSDLSSLPMADKTIWESPVRELFFASAFLAEAATSKADLKLMAGGTGTPHLCDAVNDVITSLFQNSFDESHPLTLVNTPDVMMMRTLKFFIAHADAEMKKLGLSEKRIKYYKEEFQLLRSVLDRKTKLADIKNSDEERTFRLEILTKWYADCEKKTSLFAPKTICLTEQMRIVMNAIDQEQIGKKGAKNKKNNRKAGVPKMTSDGVPVALIMEHFFDELKDFFEGDK